MHGPHSSPPPSGSLWSKPEPSAPYQKHSETSRAAAKAVTRSMQEGDHARLLENFRNAQPLGCTDEEGADQLQMNPSTYRPRRIELADTGLITQLRDDKGEIVKRATKSGRAAVVWILNSVTTPH